MRKRFYLETVLKRLIARPVMVMLSIAMITVFFGWHFPQLSFKTSVYDLAIEDLPSTIRYNRFKDIFGSDEIIRVIIKGSDIFDPATFEKITRLSETASTIYGVRRVISLPQIKKAIDPSDKWDLGKLSAIITPVAMFQKNLLSNDHNTTGLTLLLEDKADKGRVIQSVKKMIAESSGDLSVYQIGMPVISQALAEFIKKDFFHLPPITFFLIAVILFILFRNLTCLILPLSCVIISLTWTFGFMAVFHIPISILTMIVPIFLIAVGTAYCVHIVSEFTDIAHATTSPQQAVLETFSLLSLPTAIAILTTITGLVSLLVNRITAIREFAVLSIFGMFSLLVMLMIFFPVMLALLPLPKKGPEKPAATPSRLDQVLQNITDINLYKQKISLSAIVVIVIFCGIGIFRIRVETNPVEFFKEDAPVRRNFHNIYKKLSGSFPINISIKSNEKDYFEDPKHIAQLAILQEYLETLPDVDKTISLADYTKLINYITHRFDPEYYRLPQEKFELRMLLNRYKNILGEDMFFRFLDKTYSYTNILMLTHIAGSIGFLENRDRILDHVEANFSKDLTWDITGFGMVIADSCRQLTIGQIKSLSLTMILIFGIMFLLFLSYKVGFIAILPNLFPIIVNFGIMGWLGIELSMATALIASIAIGLAVDDTIHYMVRYNREFRKNLDEHFALRETIKKVGKPIIFTTVTISLGFSVLMLSSFKLTVVFGVMMVITMLSALVGDLILLPSLMMHVELVTLWDLIKYRMGKDPGEKTPIFKGLSRTQINSIFLAKPIEKFDARNVIFRKGDPSDHMYAIISGELDVLKHHGNNPSDMNSRDSTRVNILKAGEVVGEMGFLRSAPRSATVVAMKPGELLQINWKMIKRLQWIHPPTSRIFFHNLMNILCDRVDDLSDRIAQEKMII